MRSRGMVFVVVALGVLCSTAIRGAPEKADRGAAAGAPAAEAAPLIGEMRVRTMGAATFAYIEVETTSDRLGDAIGEALPKLDEASDSGKAKIAGPFGLYYPKGAHVQPDKQLPVQIGHIVREGSTGGGGDVKIRKTEPFKCATAVYTGPVAEIGQSYQKLFPAISAAGLKPSGEEREFTLYFESVESPNNVLLIQVGVK
jgi:effector-binding domain-containing protein